MLGYVPRHVTVLLSVLQSTKTRRLVGRWICSNRVTDVMGCVVPLCFPPVCMDMCICTNHDLDWTFHPMAPRKVASHCHHHKIHRFRVNTETLLKPVLQESSALGDYTAPKQYLKLNGHFSPHGYGTRCDGESRTHSFRCPQLASATFNGWCTAPNCLFVVTVVPSST